ncbi:MAG: type II toxin-antitoxin system VapC family toxin, partial [Euryarchaeota archaeon]|nr:type II toxin-antitoxin system VapC family toxin [Euryarchaeota archaeon]MCG2728350.1 type II toxin-antitoxin system VapC family toxin [Candidatus Methanoperedenaceae archaeon]
GRKIDDSAVTSVSYFEIFTRIYHKQLKHEKKYFTQFFSSVPIYFFDLKAAEESSKLMSSLYRRGTPVNQADVMIAGIGMANRTEGIITKDKDFKEIKAVSDLDILFI